MRSTATGIATTGSNAKHILLPVRHLCEWINHNILLELATAPLSKEDARLVSEAGSCHDCPKCTGHNTLLFEGIAAQRDFCIDVESGQPQVFLAMRPCGCACKPDRRCQTEPGTSSSRSLHANNRAKQLQA